MNFQDLHELLRLELLRRIQLGTLTGSRLARQVGFQQAHVSNFLNRKRALSLEGLDRVLASQNLSVESLLPIDITASIPSVSNEPMEVVPIVPSSAAMDDARISRSATIDILHLPVSRLQDNRSRPSVRHAQWQRFVAIRADPQQAAAMDPILPAGSVAVIDRHYNSLTPYRAHQPTLYAVRCGAALLIRFVDFDEGRLILRPYSMIFPVSLLAVSAHESPGDYIVGRVCMVVAEY